jgi:hypothetical protein
MIRCVQSGGPNGPIAQGELVAQWQIPDPSNPFNKIDRASVRVSEGHTRVGDLIPTKHP